MTDDQSRLVPRASAFDREKANRVLQDAHLSVEGVLDALEGCVTPQGIDRDGLIEVLDDEVECYSERLVDRILTLVRPVEGVTLSREEAATAAACVRAASRVAYMRDDLAALASRLEASS